jgi:hypothetical protein
MTTPDTAAEPEDDAIAQFIAFVEAHEGKEDTSLLSVQVGRRKWAHLTLRGLRTVLGENQRLTHENEQLRAWVCACQDDYLSPRCVIHGDPQQPKLSTSEAARWGSAFEQLHFRILRDLPADVSKLPPPEDEFWAESLDALVQFSAGLYERTWMQRLRPGTVPADTDKQGV